MQRFQQECAFLENIRHPNIVQYLSMTSDPESRLPVLLMELLDESLTKMLEHSQWPLAYHIQVDICHDIALAVAYLHSNDIIHRDLSSNNVLIMAKNRAKVTDFGMSKLTGAAPSMAPLTMCPGTLAFMPPEALREPPVYTNKLDCFSEGVIMIQVCTRLWPEPGPRTKTVQDSRSPTGTTQMPVLEPERRKNHNDLINHGHGLLPIAMDCLHYQENERPLSDELCQRLTGLKETREYRESVEQVERVQNDIAELESQMQATAQQLHELRNECRQQQQRYQSEIQSKGVQLEQWDQQIQSQERQIQELTQQLEEQAQITANVQQTNNSLRGQVEQLQQQLNQRSQQNTKPSQPPSPVQQADHQESTSSTREIIKFIEWRDGGRAPYNMSIGAAVVDGNVAYFMNWNGQTCSYDSSTQKWSKLPVCPYWYSSLAVINGLLTAIGGKKENVTDKLLIDHGKQWEEHFPPMPTRRSYAVAVTTKQHLMMAGGESGPNRLDTVEVMDNQTLVWSTAVSLPHPYSKASATMSGDQLYILGGWDKDSRSKSVLACSLTLLLQSCNETSSNSVWYRITDVPVYHSTYAAVNEELMAVGERDEEDKSTEAVHTYNPTTDSWDIIGNMPIARSYCLVAVLPTNEVMVVGGYTAKVVIANIQ